MNERQKLMKRVQICDFTLSDVSLYLDSHPDDQQALAYFKKHLDLRAQAIADYTAKYGPIRHSDYDGGNRWKWVDGPWPWQNEEV